MALYVSQARRTRRIVVVATLVGIVALGAGWAVGRSQVPSIRERVDSVQADSERIATAIRRLDIEYEQVLTGNGDSIEEGVIAPVRSVRTSLQHTLERAPWVTTAQRSALLDALANVESNARDEVSVDEFRVALGAAADLVRATLG